MSRIFMALGLLLVCVLGCSQPHGTIATSYPSGWPVPCVQVPAGAIQVPPDKAAAITNLAKFGGVAPTGFGYGVSGTTYSVFFKSTKTWDELQRGIEDQLLASGSTYYVANVVHGVVCSYSNEDGIVGVSLGTAGPHTDLLIMSIYKHDKPLPRPAKWPKLSK